MAHLAHLDHLDHNAISMKPSFFNYSRFTVPVNLNHHRNVCIHLIAVDVLNQAKYVHRYEVDNLWWRGIQHNTSPLVTDRRLSFCVFYAYLS